MVAEDLCTGVNFTEEMCGYLGKNTSDLRLWIKKMEINVKSTCNLWKKM